MEGLNWRRHDLTPVDMKNLELLTVARDLLLGNDSVVVEQDLLYARLTDGAASALRAALDDTQKSQ